MELVRLDDYQAWLLGLDTSEGRRLRVLVDPWLSERFTVLGSWLFGRRHRAWVEAEALPPIDAILLSAHFADHFDPATLARLDPSIPVYTTRAAARRLRRLGHAGVEVLGPGAQRELGPGVELHAVRPGFPYAHNSLGFLIHEQASGRRLYLETHVTDEASLVALRAEHGPVDLVIAPVESVRLFGVMLAMAAPRALRTLELLGARWVAPTGLEPGRGFGLLAWLLRCRGTLEDFRAALEAGAAEVELLELEPGLGFTVPGSASALKPSAEASPTVLRPRQRASYP